MVLQTQKFRSPSAEDLELPKVLSFQSGVRKKRQKETIRTEMQTLLNFEMYCSLTYCSGFQGRPWCHERVTKNETLLNPVVHFSISY